MAFISLRTVQTNPKEVDEELAENPGKPVIVTRNGVPVWAIMPIDEDLFFDSVLATAPAYVKRMDAVEKSYRDGDLETSSLDDTFSS